MRRYLIVANQTLRTDELAELVNRRQLAGPAEFFLVVPATPVLEMVEGATAMSTLGGSTLMPSTPEHARELAQQRLTEAVTQLQASGTKVDGTVGDRDPVRAVEAVLAGAQFDEIIVSTLPSRISKWLHQDLPRRLEHKTHLPVTHIGADA